MNFDVNFDVNLNGHFDGHFDDNLDGNFDVDALADLQEKPPVVYTLPRLEPNCIYLKQSVKTIPQIN